MSNHQTLHKGIKKPVKLLEKQEYVKKVVIGPYHNCRHKYSPGMILYKSDIKNGIKVFGYDGSGVFTLYVYIDPFDKKQEMVNNTKNFNEVIIDIIERQTLERIKARRNISS